MASEIKLQALKEGVDAVEVNEIKVSVGDSVARDQPLLEVQADKATLPVTAPMAGKIVKLLVKQGDTIKIGQPYIVIDGAAAPGGGTPTPAPAATTPAPTPAPAPAPTPPVDRTPARLPEAVGKRMNAPLPASGTTTATDTTQVPAGPATRRLARELGIDLTLVSGSGRHGRVTEEDVKAFVRDLASGGGLAIAAGAGGSSLAQPSMPAFEDFGPVERQPVRGIRKAIARQMSLAWNLIPHVTQHDLADITDLEAFRKSQANGPVKLTVTAFVLKAVTVLLKKFPHFNASFDANAGQLIHKKYYHLGVAVDTDDGLVVPVIRDADQKSVNQLAGELTAIAERARAKKLEPAEMKGGTFTITNLGGIGGTAFTPIINWPEVAILGLSRSRLTAVPDRDGSVKARLLMPLSLSYDHRVIDGADAARFTRQLADLLENPLTMLLHA